MGWQGGLEDRVAPAHSRQGRDLGSIGKGSQTRYAMMLFMAVAVRPLSTIREQAFQQPVGVRFCCNFLQRRSSPRRTSWSERGVLRRSANSTNSATSALVSFSPGSYLLSRSRSLPFISLAALILFPFLPLPLHFLHSLPPSLPLSSFFLPVSRSFSSSFLLYTIPSFVHTA